MPERARFVAKPFREADLLKAIGAVIDTEIVPGRAVCLQDFPFLRAGKVPGSSGLAQQLPKLDE
jgi:hypothetical protein